MSDSAAVHVLPGEEDARTAPLSVDVLSEVGAAARSAGILAAALGMDRRRERQALVCEFVEEATGYDIGGRLQEGGFIDLSPDLLTPGPADQVAWLLELFLLSEGLCESDGCVSAVLLYNMFSSWCAENYPEERLPSRRLFCLAMDRQFCKSKINGVWFYCGLSLPERGVWGKSA